RGLNDKGEYNPNRDWFYQNVRLMQALTKKGYDVNYSWGIGVHSHDMGGAMLPEMMRWLWRDQPVSLDPHHETERSFRKAAPQLYFPSPAGSIRSTVPSASVPPVRFSVAT